MLNEEVTDQKIRSCHGVIDVVERTYHHPCPQCRGAPSFLDGHDEYAHLGPVTEEVRPFWSPSDGTSDGTQSDRYKSLQDADKKYAAALTKTMWAWFDFNRRTEDMAPRTNKVFQELFESIMVEQVCVDHPSEGVGELASRCACGMNYHSYARNVATALRQHITTQSSNGVWLALERRRKKFLREQLEGLTIRNGQGRPIDRQGNIIDEIDIEGIWGRVPEEAWVRDVPFELELSMEPIDRQNLRMHPVPLRGAEESTVFDFGAESMHRAMQKRFARLHPWQSFGIQPIELVEPLSREHVESRWASLNETVGKFFRVVVNVDRGGDKYGGDFDLDLRVDRFPNRMAWRLCYFVFQKFIDVLAVDSGLMDYRCHHILDCLGMQFVQALHTCENRTGQSSFDIQYVLESRFFEFLLENGEKIQQTFGLEVNMNLTDLPQMGQPIPWLVPENLQVYANRLDGWREDVERGIAKAKELSEFVGSSLVRYAEQGEEDDLPVCTRCRLLGDKLCRECQGEIGWPGNPAHFGNTTFKKAIDKAGGLANLVCFYCANDFVSEGPPFDELADVIACHGKHTDFAGWRCLRRDLLTRAGIHKFLEPGDIIPSCPLGRHALNKTHEAELQSRRRN